MFNRVINKYITAKAEDTEGELWIYGDISDQKWWDEDVTPLSIREALKEMGAIKNLNIRVNSYGGSVFAGNAIINILDSYKRKNGVTIKAYIDGIAASMGSNIPMVADTIYMAENAMMMLHKPLSIVIGNADDMQKEIEILDKCEETLVANYMRHFKGTEDELRQMLSDETWLTADEALDLGLCDEIVPAVEVAASAKGVVINGNEFSADKIKNKFKFTPGEAKKEVYTYDEKLNQFGISAEMFADMNTSAETLLEVANSACDAFTSVLSSSDLTITVGDNGFECSTTSDWAYPINWNCENVVYPTSDIAFTNEQIVNALGKEYTADEILAFAKQGMDVDGTEKEKAKAYDSIISDAIEAAISNGVKAKGEAFNETKWRKILASLDYAEILDQANEWATEAKTALKAGRQVSEPWKQDPKENDNLINPEDYKF